jgi:5-methylcytosine-specific restriction endonuclease McrA
VVEMTDNEIMNMTDMPCTYCGKETEDMVKRNGIDRLDSFSVYNIANCVSCCGECNVSKGQLDPLTYIERAKQISLNNGGTGKITTNWTNINVQIFSNYKWNAINSRQKKFELTKEQFEDLRAQSCEYCNRPSTSDHSNGIDCVNHVLGYTLENCVSACFDCNMMKHKSSPEDFIYRMKRVAMCDYVFPNIPRKTNTWFTIKESISTPVII